MAAGGIEPLVAGALVVFGGVLASLLFERFRLPDVVLLLAGGILLGPVLGFVDPDAFAGISAPFATLALAVILFEGGLDLNVAAMRRRLGFTSILLVLSYFATALAVGGVLRLATGATWGVALLTGLVLAPLSSSILIPLAARLRILPTTRALLTVESALGDVLAVLAVTLYAGALGGAGVSIWPVAQSLLSSLVYGTFLALVAGILWLYILRVLQGRPYAYLVTFAAAILLYGLVEFAGGNGVVAVLVFALVLGNAEHLHAHLPGSATFRLDERIRWFHAEMSFFVRTFFFLYLGLLVTPAALGARTLAIAVAAVVAIILVRVALVYALVQQRPKERQDASYLALLLGRGLASAALATLPAVTLAAAGFPLQDVAFAVILLSNLAMTAFILVKEGGPGTGADVDAVHFDLAALDIEGYHSVPASDDAGTRS